MLRKFLKLLNNKPTDEFMDEKKTIEEFKRELFHFQTKVVYEFTDVTSRIQHDRYRKKLHVNFEKEVGLVLIKEDSISIPLAEERYSGHVKEIHHETKKWITSCLQNQFENIHSAKFSEEKKRMDYYRYGSINMSDYQMFMVHFQQKEYKEKQVWFLKEQDAKIMLDVLFSIEDYFVQMENPYDFAITFIDTLNTLNETMDKIVAYKNAKTIMTILQNMKEEAGSIVTSQIKKDRELSKLMLESDTNTDLILQMEVEYTQMVNQKRQQIEQMKMVR